MLKVGTRQTRADIGATALPDKIDSLALDTTAIGDELIESIRYTNHINHDHKYQRCIPDRC
jgi:hypothetical protein